MTLTAYNLPFMGYLFKSQMKAVSLSKVATFLRRDLKQNSTVRFLPHHDYS